MKKAIAIIILGFILSGCATTADYGSATESGIKIYHTGIAKIEQRNSEAQAHCSRYNKKAVFVRSSSIPLYDEFKCE
uniref:Lipoprotein n=1 Tax=uncultured marine microorganism HF4000_097M14 TaxID=455520 RepID=B3T1W9_9ZZZZ|nr:hypothetical protein ALOHA_HF4000097M14ctg1g22 [uncultured marine microorganism HF4000_097M14]